MIERELKTAEIRHIRDVIAEKTGVWLNELLTVQAFTRSSYAKTHGGESNEVLEFIGDAVLSYHAVRMMYERMGGLRTDRDERAYGFRAHEKDYSALKASLVSNHTLAGIIDGWDVCGFLRVGKSDADNQVDRQEKIRADLLEAIVGAIALQTQWDRDRLDEVVERVLHVDAEIAAYEKKMYRPPEYSMDNAVTTLKEYAEKGECDRPLYDESGPDMLGYDKDGRPRWACTCMVADWGLKRTVFAYSKKEAKKAAAYLVLRDRFDLTNEYGTGRVCAVWRYDGTTLEPDIEKQR